MAQLNLSLPSFQGLDLSDEKQLRKLTSYLYRLDEQLRYVLNNLGEENLSDSLRAIINTQTDATVLDEMTGQVQRLSTQIVQTAQAISLKADKETLDALGETLGQDIAALEVTAEQIRAEVSNTASGLQSQITQTQDEIKLKASKEEVIVVSQAAAGATDTANDAMQEAAGAQAGVAALEQRVSKAEAEISVQADRIQAAVTKEEFAVVEQAAQQAQSTANNAAGAASNAQSTANSASNAASNAQNTADNAAQAAQQAQNAADEAQAGTEALAGRVTKAEAKLTVQADEIALRVTKTQHEADLSGKLNADAPAIGVQTASAVVNEKGVYLSGGEIDMRTTDGEDYVNITDDGVSASSMSAPDVMPRYAGPAAIYVNPNATSAEIAAGATYRSLKEALGTIGGRVADREISVYIRHTGTEYGDIRLDRATMLAGLVIRPYDASTRSAITGSVNVSGCSGHISMWGVDLTSADGGTALHAESPATVLDLSTMTFRGAGSGSAIHADWGTRLYVYGCQMYDCGYAVNLEHSCQASIVNTAGNCKIRSAWGSAAYMSGTAPDSSGTFAPEEAWGGMVFAEGVTVDHGSGGSTPTVPTISTMNLYADYTESHREKGGVWSSDNVIQGWWDGAGRIKGCMWFDADTIRSIMQGGTPLLATLRLHMISSGRGTVVTVELAGTATAFGGGNPEVTRQYGAIASMSPRETAEITIPVQAVNDLLDGTIRGLMLYSSDTGPHKERDYSKNYAAFTGISGDSETRPRLTITYER